MRQELTVILQQRGSLQFTQQKLACWCILEMLVTSVLENSFFLESLSSPEQKLIAQFQSLNFTYYLSYSQNHHLNKVSTVQLGTVMNSHELSVPDPANSPCLLSTDKFKAQGLSLDELTQLVQSFLMPRKDSH